MANSSILDTLMPGGAPPAGLNATKAPAVGLGGDAMQGAPETQGDVATDFPQIAPLLTGKIPAVFTPLGYTSPVAEELTTRVPELRQLGIQFYQTKHDPSAAYVTFNPQKISLAEVEKADKSKTIAKKFTSVAKLLGSSVAAAEAAPVDDGATEPSDAPIPVRPAPVAPMPPGSQNTLQRSRVKNANADRLAPSARTVPGAGAILNGLLSSPR